MKENLRKIIKIFELILAVVVFFATVYFGFNSVGEFLGKDWSDIETFYEFISYILLILVGFELIRLIVIHSITTVFELMILIVARKMLSPNIEPLEMVLSVFALAILVGLNYIYAFKPIKSLEDLTS